MTRTRKDATTRHSKDAGNDSGATTSTTEKRFATSLLEKLLEYVDKAAYNMKNTKPSSRFSRRHSFSMATEDVKFFGKVNIHDCSVISLLWIYIYIYTYIYIYIYI